MECEVGKSLIDKQNRKIESVRRKTFGNPNY